MVQSDKEVGIRTRSCRQTFVMESDIKGISHLSSTLDGDYSGVR